MRHLPLISAFNLAWEQTRLLLAWERTTQVHTLSAHAAEHLPRPRQSRELVKPTQNAGACHLRSVLALGVCASSRLSFLLPLRLGGEPCCVSDQAGRSLLQQWNG